MLRNIAADIEIQDIEVMGDFRPGDLFHNAEVFDAALEKYLHEYEKAGINPRHFPDADAFLRACTD